MILNYGIRLEHSQKGIRMRDGEGELQRAFAMLLGGMGWVKRWELEILGQSGTRSVAS